LFLTAGKGDETMSRLANQRRKKAAETRKMKEALKEGFSADKNKEWFDEHARQITEGPRLSEKIRTVDPRFADVRINI